MTLKSFPRGGKKPLDKKSSDSVFKNPERHNKKKQRSGKSDKEEENFVATTAERLSYLTISEGLVVLGCVFEATEYDLIISLPGGLIGRAQVGDISESYTNLLQNLINTEDAQQNEFRSLPELYSCGDYVVCYVKSIQPQEKWQIALSLDPRLINQNVDVAYLEDGSRMLCTISSIEDHGYVVDTGINNVRAFIPAPKNNDKSLYPGKQLLCTIEEIETNENTSTIKLSTKQKHAMVPNDTEIKSLDSLMPGTKFELSVKKVLSNGLYVSFGSNHIGYINQLYLNEPLSKYIAGMEITGTMLYILPTVKFGYFSLLIKKRRNIDAIQPGHVIDGATTLFRESGGIALQLTKNGTKGFVPLKRTEVNYDQIIEKFVPGTKHKCRVLSYSWMDAMYICTMEHSLLEQKYFSVSDFKPGDVVNVRITSINAESGFVNVQVGKINGQVAPEQVSDEGASALKKLKTDKEVEARVLDVDTARKKVHFTFKKSLLTSNLPVLSDIKDAKRGSRYHGTVVQISKGGLLVKFFGNVKGWVPRTALNTETSEGNWNYSIGQTILVLIDSVNENLGKIILSVPTKEKKKKENVFTIGERVEGTIIESSTQGVYLRISKNDGQDVSTGFLPAGHMSPCTETATLLASKSIPGDTLSALVFATVPSLILTRTFLTQEKYRSFEQLKIGDCIPCSVKDIEPNGMRVILPVAGCTPFGYVSYSNVSNFHLLQAHQILFAKVISINRKEKQVNLTLSLKKLFDGLPDLHSRIMTAVDTLTLHFNKLTELARNPFYSNRPVSSVLLGQKVTGKVDKITADGLVVKLENNLLGIVSKNHYSGNRKVGDTVSGTVMWKNYVHELVELTMIPALMKSINEQQDKHREIPQDKLIRGKILMVTNWFVLIVLKGHGKGSLAAMPVKRHVNEVRPDLSPYIVHSKIRCYIVSNPNESDVMPICMVKSAFEEKPNIETKSAANKLKRKKMNSESDEVPAKKVKKSEKAGPDVKPLSKRKKAKAEEEENSEENSEEIDEPSKNVKQKRNKKLKKIKQDIKPPINIITDDCDKDDEKPRIPECGFFWDDKPNLDLLAKQSSSDSEDSEDETEKQPKQKKKKLSAAERREKERQKEREIREKEEVLASNQLPTSVDQFDRLVLASPDSSIIWLQYMAYHLQTTEIDKARAVARKAVKTISFREENERLNVWNAWLNLESKFGTPESLNSVFQEAVRSNDALKVYSHMLTVHLEGGRQFELEKIINTMIGKFKQNPQVWIDCGATLLKMGLKDKSRHIMQRALQSLPASEHVNLMARFATLENKLGDKERAQTLFEQILSSYPKRVDIWSCYVDSLVKSNDIDIARKILERAVVQTLPPRKMRSLFKKFISFEEQHGTQEDISRVQKMAAEYVEKQCNQDD